MHDCCFIKENNWFRYRAGACVSREVIEEAGISASVEYLSIVCENFFDGVGGIIDGKDCHTLEFYYLMKIDNEDYSTWKNVTDDGEELVWIPIDEIAKSNIKPSFIPEWIEEIMKSEYPIHIIEDRDRTKKGD